MRSKIRATHCPRWFSMCVNTSWSDARRRLATSEPTMPVSKRLGRSSSALINNSHPIRHNSARFDSSTECAKKDSTVRRQASWSLSVDVDLTEIDNGSRFQFDGLGVVRFHPQRDDTGFHQLLASFGSTLPLRRASAL